LFYFVYESDHHLKHQNPYPFEDKLKEIIERDFTQGKAKFELSNLNIDGKRRCHKYGQYPTEGTLVVCLPLPHKVS
jgi:hypothetical protein